MTKPKILIIQTAFIGDVILATSLIEALSKSYPHFQIDFFLRSGNQSIVESNPNINKTWIWDKKKNKTLSLIKLLFEVRKQKYDYVLNIQRFFNSGFLTAFSGGKIKVGFNKNPLSFLFSKSVNHMIPHPFEDHYLHEVQRNFLLAKKAFPTLELPKPNDLKTKIYFNKDDEDKIKSLNLESKYFVIAPSSVWYTKQWHQSKWKELVLKLSNEGIIYLIGAPSDNAYVSQLMINSKTVNLCGKLSLRQSALLMKNASRVFVNDSAPLHLASSVNANTTAIFCSTIPEFGYSPLSDNQKLIQLSPRLDCMPCGLHGHKACPKGHFKCAMDIQIDDVFQTITDS